MANRKNRRIRQLEEMGKLEPTTVQASGADDTDATGDSTPAASDSPTGLGLVGEVDGSGALQSSRGTILPGVVDEAMRQSTITGRFGHDYLQTNEERLYRVLMEHRERLADLGAWKTPLGLFLAVVTTLAVSEFPGALGIPGASWQAFFMLCAVVTGVWLISALIRRFHISGSASLKQIVDEIKQDRPPS